MLDAAYAAGARYVDAARSYGRAEEFVAGWLERRGIAAGEVTVGSKWGYTYTGEWHVDAAKHEVHDLALDTLRRQLAESRALLGGHLRLYQIHSATLESGVLEDAAVRDELVRLRATGVAIGVTVTGPRQAETIERALELECFDTVQATWNLIERSAGDALAHAHDAGLGVIVKEALANGRLAGEDALALATALAQPWADVVLSGAVTPEMLRSNMAALQVPRDEVERALERPAEEPERYWSERARLEWN